MIIRTLWLAGLTLTLACPDASAQQAVELFDQSARAGSTSPPASLFSPYAEAEFSDVQRSSVRRFGEHVLYTLGFSLVGSGLGYFASQVVYSDWEKENNSTFATERRTYALTGGSIGAVLGYVIGSRPANAGIGRRIRTQQIGRQNVIPNAELQNSAGSTAFEVVQGARPEWLIVRAPPTSIEQPGVVETERGIAVLPGVPTIKVYLDDAFQGGVETLEYIPVNSIESIERLTPAEATARWGAGHQHGAILVHSF